MRTRNLLMVVSAVSLLYLANVGAVLGADTPPASVSKPQGAVNFKSGGVGDDDTAAFKQAALTYPLELQFTQQALPKNEYLSDVKVTIRDRAGKVLLDTTSAGPFMLVELPTGRYDVEASHEGEAKRQNVEVHTGQHRKVMFVWPGQAGSSDVPGAARAK